MPVLQLHVSGRGDLRKLSFQKLFPLNLTHVQVSLVLEPKHCSSCSTFHRKTHFNWVSPATFSALIHHSAEHAVCYSGCRCRDAIIDLVVHDARLSLQLWLSSISPPLTLPIPLLLPHFCIDLALWRSRSGVKMMVLTVLYKVCL